MRWWTLIALVLFGCRPKLTNEEAARKIRENMQGNDHYRYLLHTGVYPECRTCAEFPTRCGNLVKLVELGIVQTTCVDDRMSLSLTPSGEEKLRGATLMRVEDTWTLDLARYDLIEVTEVTFPRPDVASALANFRWVPTELGKQFMQKGIAPSDIDQPKWQSYEFVRKDDWQLAPPKRSSSSSFIR